MYNLHKIILLYINEMFKLKINNSKPKDWSRIPLIIHNQMCYYEYMISAVDKLKFMGNPLDHPWWKTGSPESFLGYPINNYFDSSLKGICFSVINTKFACFLFNHVPTYRELGRPSGDFGGHVGSPDQVIRLSTLRPEANDLLNDAPIGQ